MKRKFLLFGIFLICDLALDNIDALADDEQGQGVNKVPYHISIGKCYKLNTQSCLESGM